MKIEYKPCTKQDIKKLYELSKKLIDTYENIQDINYTVVMNWIQNKLNHEISNYYQIYYNHQHVGYIHIINEDEIEIDDFYIFDPYQNLGIGSYVLNDIINFSSKNIFLYVFIKNDKAVSFYRKLGFQISETIKNSRYIMRLSK